MKNPCCINRYDVVITESTVAEGKADLEQREIRPMPPGPAAQQVSQLVAKPCGISISSRQS